MRSTVAAFVIAGALMLAGTAVSVLATLPAEEAPAAVPVNATSAEGHDHMSHGAGAHPWQGGTGTIPTLADAMLKLERRGSIIITDDAAFNPANGVRSGSGTYEDPFVISGWYVDQILIADTSLAFEIKDSYVADILVLDWTGQGGYVHHNHVQNLRTNRNVERTGDPSATVIEKNLILRVEELRHFDGEVRHNTIGKEGVVPLVGGQAVAFNIAGLNGAGIHDNLVFGGVDMKIHGHHHTDKPGVSSHNHGKADESQSEAHDEDHQLRYVDFHFYRNHIVDDKFGMRYNDLAHAGDDRQATSEQEPMLEKPHVHHTRITIQDNVIEGATLRVAAVNSLDERHLAGETATISIVGNKIVKPVLGDGVILQDVRNATVLIEGNVVEKPDVQLTVSSAILLTRFWNSTVLVTGNDVGAWEYGVRAHEFDAATNWTVADNRAAGSDHPVYWDDSVANPPGGASGAHAGHEHGHEEDAAAPASALRRLRLA